MSLYYRSLIQQGKLLDIYPNAAVAYSLRKLRSSYTGSSIRVRRNVDSLEQDFGFDSLGNLDTAGILNFFGNNLLLQSENFETGSWQKTNTTVTAGSIVGPNGVDLSCKFDETSTSGLHALTASQFGSNSGKDYLFSIYLKAGERNVIDIISALNGPISTCRINLTTGSIVSSSNYLGSTVINAGNGWWKVELTIRSNTTLTSTGFQLRLTNGTSQSYVGNVGWGCYVWGAQVSGYNGTPVPYFRTTTISAANGLVTTYYDQSGNGNNLTNINASLQYRIVSVGHLYVNSDNNLPSTQVISQGFYALGSTISTSNPLVNFNVYRSTAANMILFGNSSATGRPVLNLHQGSVGSRLLVTRLTSSGVQDFSLPFETNGSFITSTTRNTSDYTEVSVNNNIIGGSVLGVSTASNISHLGRFNSSANSSGGELQEMIIWKQDYVSLKTNISDKINEYYGIY